EKALNGDPEVTYDSPFWRTRSPIENIDKIKAPTLIFGALNDIFQRDEPLLYEKLKQNNVDTRLMIYNGDHVGHFVQGFLGVNKLGPMPFLLLQWFDHHLKGIDSGVESIPPVTQYVKNHADHLLNGFSTTTDWPHPEAAPERWYLHGDLSLTQDAPVEEEPVNTMEVAPFATIEYGKSEDGSLLIFNVEPNDGTKCSASYHQWTLGIAGVASFNKCYRDNRELEADALNYETALMEEDYYINGPLQADIWISTTAHEAVLSVRVDEVTANGRTVKPLTNGLLLASARRVDESRSRFMNGEMIQPYHYLTEDAVEPVVPGEVFKMQVEIFPTSAIIRKGHKLRVSIAPSNDAQGMLNLPRQELAKDGVTSIHNSPDYPSSIVLPIVPLSALN
ncbi:MAG: CocE/NonD family hydrolase, partial [Pseudomonadota bacterium]